MAGGGGSGEEMNPFIAYVDLFSSVILVLLLFVLIMFVNVGYYMQFNAKIDDNQTVVSKEEDFKEQKKEDNRFVELKKEDFKEQKREDKKFDKEEEYAKEEPVVLQNKEIEGNTVGKKSQKFAAADFVEADMLIAFKNNEYFLSKDIVKQVADSMVRIIKTNPSTLFYISVGDSRRVISATQTKQVSLGRVLSLKNSLEAVPELNGKIKINYKPTEKFNYEYGYIKIDRK